MSARFEYGDNYLEVSDFCFYKNEADIASVVNKIKAENKNEYYIDKLIDDGNEIYLISNRSNKQYQNAYLTTKNNLEINDIKYSKLIITETNDKSKECIEEKIDLMIDDRASNCMKLLDKNINCLLFKTKYEKRIFDNLNSVSSWSELYEYIKNSTK